MATDAQSEIKKTPPIQRLRIGLNVGVQILLGLMIFGIVNYLSYRHYKRWDFTQNQRYTLSSSTTGFLSKLKAPTKIHAIFVRGTGADIDVRNLLQEYKRAGKSRLKVKHIDPARDPSSTEELKNRYKISLDRNGILIAAKGKDGDRTRFIPEEELYTIDPEQGQVLGFRGEAALTSGLIGLNEQKKQQIYLIDGKGRPRTMPDGSSAWNKLNEFAIKQNTRIDPLNLADHDKIPENADALIILSPQSRFSKREIDILKTYWDGKRGALLMMLNPNHETPGLREFVKTYGLTLRNDRILKAANTTQGPKKYFTVESNFVPGNPITTDLLGRTTAFNGQTQSIGLPNEDQYATLKGEGIELAPLLEARRGYWGETKYTQELPVFNDSEDFKSPLYVAVAAEKGAINDERIRIDSSRMVVVTNARLIDPDEATPQNYDFVFSSLNWILDREELIGIAPKKKNQFRINLSPDEISRIFQIMTLILPGAVLFFGLFIWSLRRA